jgi:hypothetical protein
MPGKRRFTGWPKTRTIHASADSDIPCGQACGRMACRELTIEGEGDWDSRTFRLCHECWIGPAREDHVFRGSRVVGSHNAIVLLLPA